MRNDLISKAILNCSRDAIFIINTNLKIVFWTKPAFDVFKYDELDVLNNSFLDLLIQEHYVEDFENEFNKFLEGKPNLLFGELLELFGKRKDNFIFHLELELNEIILNNERLIVCIARDVTNKINYEGELTKLIEELQVTKEYIEQNANEFQLVNFKLVESEERLEILNANKDRFFSIIAHDLKGPFQSLLGYSELLKDSASDFSVDEIMEFSSSLHNSALNLFKLLENLLNWSSIQRGKINYEPKIIDLKELVFNNFELISPRAKMKEVILINNVNTSFIAFCDENMLDTVIRNLLSNAIKFTKKDCSIAINIQDYGSNSIRIEIKDTGLGMTNEVKQKLFNLGTKVTTLGTENEVGTGLGLLLCKEMVELNKGKIWIESELGIGSSFFFTVPKTEVIK